MASELEDVAEDLMSRLSQHVKHCGSVVIGYSKFGHFVVGSEWGEEAPGSPMAGAAAYGTHEDLGMALQEMLEHHDHD